MEKFSLKSLLTIVVILLIGIVAIWRINQGPKKVEAGWFNEAWSYRKAITLTNSGTGQTNVYVALTIGTSDTSRFQADAGDIRFTKQNGELLPYYIVSGAGTASTVIHINFDIYPAGDSTFYLYYGNSSADNGFSASDFTTAASNSSTNLLDEELSPAPIAYWNFDEGVGTTVYDMGPKQKHGIFGSGSSAPSWQSEDQCIAGRCILFNGGQTINLPNEIISNTNIRTQGVTYQAWVKLTNNNQEMLIFGQNISSGYSDSASGGIRIRSNNKASVVTYDDSAGYKYADSNTVLETNKWYLLTGTYNNTDQKMYIYVNGKLDNSTTVSNTTFSRIISNDYNKFGAIYNNGVSRQFFGFIDEPKIYAYARTATQIKQDYNAGRAGIGSMKGGSVNVGGTQVRNIKDHLVAHYKFDEGYGRNVNNWGSIGSSINGYFIGNTTPVWVTGKTGKGLFFDGLNAHFNVYNHNDLKITGQDKTISVWFNHSSTDDGGYILSKPWHGMGGYNWGITAQSNSRINFSIGASTSWSVSPTQTYQKDVWNHLAISIANPNVKIFLNGKKISDTNHTITNWSPNGGDSNVRLAVGCLYPYDASTCNSTPSAFGGYLDEVKIYNTALSDAEIKLDYNQGAQFVMGKTNQTIGGTTTSLEYCIPGDTSHCAPPIAEYKFDEGIGTSAFDTSGNNNNGVLVNSPSWTIGKIGKSLNFGTTASYVNIPTISPAITGQQLTISGWFNINAFSGVQRLISVSNAYPNFGLSSTSLYVHTTTTNGNDVNIPYFTLPTTCQTGWHHLSLTWNTALSSDNINVYCDGKNIGKGTLINSINGNLNVNSLWIGHNTASYLGKIDHVKIYNYARTPAQIAYDYNKGAPVGWWKFDECEGTTINDWSGNANNLNLTIGIGGSQVSAGTCSIGDTSAWSNGSIGKINSSIKLDGTDDWLGLIPQPQIQTSPNLFTITGYINPGNLSSRFITPQSNGLDQFIGYDASVQGIYINIAESSDTNERRRISTNGSTPLNTWTHFAILLNDKNIKIYINGKLNAEYNETINIGGWTSNWSIGQRGNNTLWFNGLLDDVRIYNYALTSEQVKQVYNNGAVNFR